MATNRPTMHQLAKERHKDRLAEIEEAVAEGRLTVRQMTKKERAESDRRFAAGRPAREARSARSRNRRVGAKG